MSPISDPGEKSLSTLLSTLTTTLHPSTFVFTTHPSSTTLPPFTHCQHLFREPKGITAIVTKSYAEEHSLDYFFPCRMITLNVESSLEAVGFMAVVSGKLAERGMGVNPVSGFWHDHLFVPVGREGEAMDVLGEVARERREQIEEGVRD